MTRFAENTSVPVDRSVSEIRHTILRYGGSKFVHAEEDTRAIIVFEAHNRRVMFELPLPDKNAEEFTRRKRYSSWVDTSEEERADLWEQACRRQWRALALCIKAKLETVESGIHDFESEFLANIVLANGKTVGKWLQPQLQDHYKTGKLPPLLGTGDRT